MSNNLSDQLRAVCSHLTFILKYVGKMTNDNKVQYIVIHVKKLFN